MISKVTIADKTFQIYAHFEFRGFEIRSSAINFGFRDVLSYKLSYKLYGIGNAVTPLYIPAIKITISLLSTFKFRIMMINSNYFVFGRIRFDQLISTRNPVCTLKKNLNVTFPINLTVNQHVTTVNTRSWTDEMRNSVQSRVSTS